MWSVEWGMRRVAINSTLPILGVTVRRRSRISNRETITMRTPLPHRRACTARRAMATLEFVMALPVLLLLMVGITWLGFSVISRSEALIEARDKAWKKRFDNPKQKPLIFPTGVGAVKNPRYSQAGDYVTET